MLWNQNFTVADPTLKGYNSSLLSLFHLNTAVHSLSADISPSLHKRLFRLTTLWLPCLALCAVLFLPLQAMADAANPGTNEEKEQQDTYRELETFANVLTLVQQYYVDQVDMRAMMHGAINGMLSSLDPHSAYMSPEDFQELEEETTGSFTGVGIEVTIREGILTTVAPIEGTPADRLGIKPGDQILRIDGTLTKNMTLMEAMKKMRGPKGSTVTLTINRSQWRGTRDFTLVREDIPLFSVKYMEIEPGYGYIRISNFQDSTTGDVQSALESLRARRPIKGLALDLRNNPGGLLDQAIKVADIFLDHGVIVSTRGRNNQEQILYDAHPDTRVENYPIVVLINGGSASGSEIVAGALQDHKRAQVLGTTSFGKGSVQTIIPLPDGAGIRLTTAKYYTPSGDSIQATGIHPDIVVPLETPPGMDTGSSAQLLLRERDLPGHLSNDSDAALHPSDATSESSSAHFNQEDAFQQINSIMDLVKRLEQDNQLRRALEVLKKNQTAKR